jgi:hypothetical protein
MPVEGAAHPSTLCPQAPIVPPAPLTVYIFLLATFRRFPIINTLFYIRPYQCSKHPHFLKSTGK